MSYWRPYVSKKLSSIFSGGNGGFFCGFYGGFFCFFSPISNYSTNLLSYRFLSVVFTVRLLDTSLYSPCETKKRVFFGELKHFWRLPVKQWVCSSNLAKLAFPKLSFPCLTICKLKAYFVKSLMNEISLAGHRGKEEQRLSVSITLEKLI